MLLVYLEESAMNEQEREQCYVDSAALTQDLHREGCFVAAAPLHPVSTATSVRVREDKMLVTDGPFAETREQLGGFYIVEAANLDEALKIAARIPPARVGTIEVRPVLAIDGIANGNS